MKFQSITLFYILTMLVAAQGISIGYLVPANKYIRSGQELLVEVVQYEDIASIGIAIGISSCSAADPCQMPSYSNVGYRLYTGLYTPTPYDGATGVYRQYFTVVIPTSATLVPGQVRLNVVFAGLFGPDNSPGFNTTYTTLNFVG